MPALGLRDARTDFGARFDQAFGSENTHRLAISASRYSFDTVLILP
jgi:hypothetical protein